MWARLLRAKVSLAIGSISSRPKRREPSIASRAKSSSKAVTRRTTVGSIRWSKRTIRNDQQARNPNLEESLAAHISIAVLVCAAAFAGLRDTPLLRKGVLPFPPW